MLDLFGEHRERADPEAVITVEEAVNHEFLLGFAVPGDVDDEVVFAFIVAIAAGLEARDKGRHRKMDY